MPGLAQSHLLKMDFLGEKKQEQKNKQNNYREAIQVMMSPEYTAICSFYHLFVSIFFL